MAVIHSTEEDLRQLSYAKPYLAVKYHNECFPICQELYKTFEQLSKEDKYKEITFVRIDADENRVARQLINKDVYSFMAIYKNGFLVESRTISSEEDIKTELDKLALIIE